MKQQEKEVRLDRVGIKTLIADGHSRTELAVVFKISRAWFRQYLDHNIEPHHPGVTYYINWKTKLLLAHK